MSLRAAQVLGEALRAFELRGGGARAEHGDARRAQRIGHAGDQRRLRARPRRGRCRCCAPSSTTAPRIARVDARRNSAQRAIPGLPGAAMSLPQLGDCLRRQASASSRPPDPKSRIFMDLPDDTRAGLLANVAPGDNSPALSVSELSGALKRTVESAFGHVRVRGEISGFKRHALGPLLFHAEGRERVHRRGDLARQRRRARLPPRGRRRGHRDRQAHHLSRPLEVPDRRRADGACGRGRAARAAREAAQGARRRGAVRRRAQAPAAVPAARDRRRHLADRRGDPRHPPPARGPLPDARHRVAGAGPGRGRGGEGRGGDPRLLRDRSSRGPT